MSALLPNALKTNNLFVQNNCIKPSFNDHIKTLNPAVKYPLPSCLNLNLQDGLNAQSLSTHLNAIKATQGPPAVSSVQTDLMKAQFRRVEISGDDNRCWLRSPWFQVLHHHVQNGTLDNLQHRMEQAIQDSNCPEVIQWRLSNPQGVSEAIAQVDNAPNSLTIDHNGRFSTEVEDLMVIAAMAVFSQPDTLSQVRYKGQAYDALDCIRHCEAGYDQMSSTLLKSLGASAALFTEHSGDKHTAAALPVSWMGDKKTAQTNCLIYHQNTDMGHFEIMLRDPSFTPEASRHKPSSRLEFMQDSPLAQPQTLGSQVDIDTIPIDHHDFRSKHQPIDCMPRLTIQLKTNAQEEFLSILESKGKKSSLELLKALNRQEAALRTGGL